MPDWKYLKDKDGNIYYIDRNWKIYTSGKPIEKYKPVSILGIDYYVHHGYELIKRHHPIKGLIILKSIVAMPENNNAIYKAKVKAIRMINHLKSRHGERYKLYNEKANPLLYRSAKKYMLLNPLMRYSFSSDRYMTILKRKVRKKYNYHYYGLQVGLSKNSNAAKSFDMLIGIDAERFDYQPKNIRSYEKNWRNSRGFDDLIKKRIIDEHNKIIYTFTDGNTPGFRGAELFFLYNKTGYVVRAITSHQRYANLKGNMINLLKQFTIAK